MGINTQGIIEHRFGVSDVIEVLANKFNVNPVIEDTHDKNFKSIFFNYKGEDRIMSVFVNYSDLEHIGFTGMRMVTLIDLNLWGSSIELIEGVVEEFGGYMVDDDCSDDWRFVEIAN